MAVDEYAELVCPLPVIRLSNPDDGDSFAQIGACGEALHVDHVTSNDLMAGGEIDIATTWTVECRGGHTLLLPDYEANDPCSELGFDAVLGLVQEALESLGTTAKGGGGMALVPLSAGDQSVSSEPPAFEVNPAEWQQLIAGTSLRGYVNPFSYAELVAAFGEPMTGTDQGGKVDAEWLIRWPDGVVATIYNYKDGPNYLGDEGTQVEQITEWHVGGYPHGSVDVVQRIADVLAEGAS